MALIANGDDTGDDEVTEGIVRMLAEAYVDPGSAPSERVEFDLQPSMLDSLPRADGLAEYWVEDDLVPFTEADRLREARWARLYDMYGPEVARLWLEQGCPIPFHFTEIIRPGATFTRRETALPDSKEDA